MIADFAPACPLCPSVPAERIGLTGLNTRYRCPGCKLEFEIYMPGTKKMRSQALARIGDINDNS